MDTFLVLAYFYIASKYITLCQNVYKISFHMANDDL